MCERSITATLSRVSSSSVSFFFFFNDTATPEIYTLSLHDALPISAIVTRIGTPTTTRSSGTKRNAPPAPTRPAATPDRKSTRLNSSHPSISYAVFCLKKKKKNHNQHKNRLDRTTNHKKQQHTHHHA